MILGDIETTYVAVGSRQGVGRHQTLYDARETRSTAHRSYDRLNPFTEMSLPLINQLKALATGLKWNQSTTKSCQVSRSSRANLPAQINVLEMQILLLSPARRLINMGRTESQEICFSLYTILAFEGSYELYVIKGGRYCA